MALAFLDKLEATRPFTELEAWGLFRIAALGEAVGWSLLITGIVINRYQLPGHRFSVPIAGQIHGTLFLIYFGLLIAIYSSLRWPRKRFILAIIAGIMPFGTLIFEQWIARTRQNKFRQTYFRSVVLTTITVKLRLNPE